MRAQRQELRERLRESIAVFAEETLRIPKYDFNKSTKENYQASRDSKTYGEYTQPYAEIRKTLDINYHGVYTLERQEVQDKMIAEVMDKGQCEAHPWIIFTAGAMGAGKSRTMTWLSEKGIFPLSQVVLIDPDMFKSEFPEWKDYVRINADAAGTHTRRESGYMCEIAQEAAMRQKKHLWVDGSLRDGEWYQSVFRKIAEDHPAYQIAIFHVNADEDVVKARAQRRGEETGRFVPLAELLDSIRRVPQTVDLLTPLSHFVATIDNSGNVPRFSKWVDPRRKREDAAVDKADSCNWLELERRLRFKGTIFENIPMRSRFARLSQAIPRGRGTSVFADERVQGRPPPVNRARSATSKASNTWKSAMRTNSRSVVVSKGAAATPTDSPDASVRVQRANSLEALSSGKV